MTLGTEDTRSQITIGLNAVIVSVIDQQPNVLLVQNKEETSSASASNASDQFFPTDNQYDVLPFGPFYPAQHPTLESGLRSWVGEQTNQEIGYVEQLYTFGNAGRDPREQGGGPRVISVGYLALVQDKNPTAREEGLWRDWYRYFPWEDWREGRPEILDRDILPALKNWIEDADSNSQKKERKERAAITFGLGETPWNDELVLERFELLYEAAMVTEAQIDTVDSKKLGIPMALDHRRILATAIGRLRGKIKYRPVVFELMPPTFTLLQLQRVVEALSGSRLHKQNFRRLIEKKGLVEATGRIETQIRGRPAAQFRFRREVLIERQALGVRQN
ncbi:MAG: hypothetical protein V7723_00180 [Sneathiella sp.]|uniref:NUDIX hydrolase n=1 Tax=Sneathiella sp. TaxID=1964365 RepID=UPI003001EA00